MLVVLQKWQIQLKGINGAAREFYISDNYYENVLRKLSEISFNDVNEIIIRKIIQNEPNVQSGTLTDIERARLDQHMGR